MEFLIQIWQTYPVLLDIVLYFLVFAAAARVGFAKSFPSYEGKLLAVAVGLFLSVSLAIAQRSLGFSLERMGPVAAFILCGVVFIAAYRFMRHAQVPTTLTVLLSGFMGLALARAVMPDATGRFMRDNPILVLLAFFGVAYWTWHNSQGFLERVAERRPGRVLGKHHLVPDETFLKKEGRFVKKRLRNVTRENVRKEKALTHDLDNASTLANRGKDSAELRTRLQRLLDTARTKINEVHQNCDKLLQADEALRRVDKRWFKQAHAFHLSDLTPEQQKLLKEAILEERRRIHTEKKLQQLQQEVKGHLEAVMAFVGKARASLAHGALAGTDGWIAQAQTEHEKTLSLEQKILDWEKRLNRLVRKQLAELRRAA